MSQPQPATAGELPNVDLKPLLTRLWPLGHPDAVSADEIANAISYFFTNQVSDVQAASLLMCLHFTSLDRQSDVLAKTAAAMLRAAAQVNTTSLKSIISQKNLAEGGYAGGLCDIVGTGGDSHNTFNISTTSSILASSLLLMAKHGNKASTSKSGSADLLANMQPTPPQIHRVRPDTITQVYSATNYAFLFAPVFHPGMRHVAPIRKQLPWRTLFNLVGPLANPCELEARVIGVARKDLGPVFADALKISGARKAMVVCGDEELDEISCAGPTLCWRLTPTSTEVEHFILQPSDFGLPAHPLSTVSPGKEPAENAAILAKILNNEMPDDDPILHFVLINTAALLVVSGICDADSSNMGHGCDDGAVIQETGPGGGRWKEGVRRATWAIKSGEAARQWAKFVEVTNSLSD
ncbi:anthranilate phosphoribosyltransferase [Diplogelasinospora grovesii]|uniref:Anthranilate phosphoribosyltransferase n=1 Tax=Diplogelasinospora grovesii TaxID=303347 RepID=A0AAN6N432_9PEZI|nr:anthranilate phosphoribosyltransferase [Diplogelasinospora grovesii]